MKGKLKKMLVGMSLCLPQLLLAQNPIIQNQFSADPTARVFNGRMYVYPSHDIPAPEEYARKDWFCMADYHVFSSENLTDWTDHGMVLSQEQVPWVNAASFSMWAPDCVERNGNYYFYFPAGPKEGFGRGFSVGVAISKDPAGPFVPQERPIAGVQGIDPNVFIDNDGQAYLYWSGRGLMMAKLKDNMLELASEPQSITGLPDGFKEGPFLFRRGDIYYLTYPWVRDKTETMAYSTSSSPMGPFTFGGLLMEESPTGCWTNHGSLVEYKGQWYLFYHHNDLSTFDKCRSVRVDSLFFRKDGSIQTVRPTLRGVGITPAAGCIQPDRYSAISDKGVTVDFLDADDTFQGWKTTFKKSGAWVRYNRVDFQSGQLNKVKARVRAAGKATLQIRLDAVNGPLLAEMKVNRSADWTQQECTLSVPCKGVHDLFFVSKNGKKMELDKVEFSR